MANKYSRFQLQPYVTPFVNDQSVQINQILRKRYEDNMAANDLFSLRVRGESMTGVGILPNDFVIVRRQPTASNGDIVVALVENDATVKTFWAHGRRVELRPANSAFVPIELDIDVVVILGKVIEVRRNLL